MPLYVWIDTELLEYLCLIVKRFDVHAQYIVCDIGYSRIASTEEAPVVIATESIFKVIVSSDKVKGHIHEQVLELLAEPGYNISEQP